MWKAFLPRLWELRLPLSAAALQKGTAEHRNPFQSGWSFKCREWILRWIPCVPVFLKYESMLLARINQLIWKTFTNLKWDVRLGSRAASLSISCAPSLLRLYIFNDFGAKLQCTNSSALVKWKGGKRVLCTPPLWACAAKFKSICEEMWSLRREACGCSRLCLRCHFSYWN